ncbi:hypothetical protein [Zoogloea sp.]|jgi:hypothetical protein|uniref:hypothetical protein n=1 Tax=Zoogloea sp. TaxID=49181 RepID=UPI0035B2C2CD
MNTTLVAGIGLLVALLTAWQVLRSRSGGSRAIPAEWIVAIGRIANDQALGHHRDARRGALQVIHALRQLPKGSPVSHHVRIKLAALLAKDPVYPDVVHAIRTACVVEPAVSELALCVRLRHFLIEDIRQCEELAECLGQIRRRDTGAEAILIARFHHAA